MSDITLGVTGHRNLSHPDLTIKQAFTSYLKLLQPKLVLTGVALGYDQLCAECCIELNIPFTAAVPFDGQEDLWSSDMKVKFYNILLKTKEVVVVNPGPYERWKLNARNCWIVDHCDCICSYLIESKGGTKHCVDYALKKNKPVFNLAKALSAIG